MEQRKIHQPVLLNEVMEYLNLKDASLFVDATLDGGGHSLAALQAYASLSVIGIEYDPQEYSQFWADKKIPRLETYNESYVNMEKILNGKRADAVLFDLGVSSWHYSHSERGFSFMRNEALDMRFNPQIQTMRAEDVVNGYTNSELEFVIGELGEEKFAKSIASQIVQARRVCKINSTFDLVSIIERAVPAGYRNAKIHCATKTFQALRMEVNKELTNIREGLRAAVNCSRKGARVAVISFHGLEDKTVRMCIKEMSEEGKIKWVTKDTVRPKWPEVKANPRARSAKMKIFEIL